MSKLALGTVQFGQDYGINNKGGQVAKDQVAAILDLARKNGIEVLDTAHNYGESEAVIGDYFKEKGSEGFKVVTKLPSASKENARSILEESFTSLGVDSLYGCIFHNFPSYTEHPELLDLLKEYKDAGRVEKIGFSIYTPAELEEIIEKDLPLDLVQFPFSVFDQRFAPMLPVLKEREVEVHVRSVFLQGLVFKEASQLPKGLKTIAPKLAALHEIAGQSGLTVAELCLNFALANPLIDKVVVGVDSTQNLEDNIRASQKAEQVAALAGLEALGETDEMIILPFNWPKP
ncbi:MAG: aldo/keto reductase [bacterium]